VRHLVELHGGTVRAANAADGPGAVFTIALPLEAAAPAPLDERRQPGAAAASGAAGDEGRGTAAPPTALAGLRVLVVDDEADARQLLGVILGRAGATVEAVASAAQALEALPRFRPDVLVSDIGMPGRDGYSLLRELRGRAPDAGGEVPAVALTAYARADDRRASLLAGFQLHLAKPVDPDELVLAVASLASRGRRPSA
jgi:CheY-like chemotaxis protein